MPLKRAKEKRSGFRKYGFLPPGRKERIGKRIDQLAASRPVQGVKNLSIGLDMKVGALHTEGKTKRAAALRFGADFVRALLPPKGDVKRGVLYVFGGKEGRRLAKEIKQKQIAEEMKRHLPKVETQLKEIIAENNLSMPPEEFERWKNEFTLKRVKHQRSIDEITYWGLLSAIAFMPLAEAGLKGASVAAEREVLTPARYLTLEAEHETMAKSSEAFSKEATNKFALGVDLLQKKLMRKKLMTTLIH